MIDIHCHILPGIDDGPPTLEAAMALVKALVDDGVTHVVATPHVFPGRFENWRSSIAEEAAAFARVLDASGLPITMSWAGEVRLCPEALDLLARNELPMLSHEGSHKTMLLEMPDGQIPLGSERLVGHLFSRGIRPVIVHPERNRAVMERPERLRPFVESGCRVQVTAGSVVGQFGPKAQAAAEALLRNDWVHAIATDAHNLQGRRPCMRAARAWLAEHFDEDTAYRLTVSGPASLCGQPVPRAAAHAA